MYIILTPSHQFWNNLGILSIPPDAPGTTLERIKQLINLISFQLLILFVHN